MAHTASFAKRALAAALLALAAGYAFWPDTHLAPALAAASSRPAAQPFTAGATRPDVSLPLAIAATPDDAEYRAVARLLASLHPSAVTEERLTQLAARWARLNPVAAFAWAAALADERQHNFALSQVLEVWTHAQPREAITAILQSDLPDSEHDHRLQQAVSTWCMMEPASAQQWLTHLPDENLKTSLLITAVDHMDAGWATYWLAYAAATPETADDDRSALGKMLVHALSARDPRTTADTTLAQARSSGNYTLASAALAAWAMHDVASAAAYVRQTATIREQETLIPALIRPWAAQDAASASKWAAALPEGRSKELALGQSIQAWAQTDPVAAVTFLRRTSPANARSRDAAASGLAPTLANTDPQSAYEWARLIHSPTQRETALASVLTTWLAKDEAAALPYLQAADLSVMARQQAIFLAGEIHRLSP